MKNKLLLLVVLVLMIGMPVSALRLNLGMGVGMNIGGLRTDEFLERSEEDNVGRIPQIGVTVGLIGRAQIVESFGVQAEAMFTLTGGGISTGPFELLDEEYWSVERETYFTFQFPVLAYYLVPYQLLTIGDVGFSPAPHVGISYDWLAYAADDSESVSPSRFGSGTGGPLVDEEEWQEWNRSGISWVVGVDLEAIDETGRGGVGLRLSRQISGFGPEDSEEEERLLTSFTIALRGLFY